MKTIKFLLYTGWMFIQMLYLFLAAILVTLPVYILVSIVCFILFKQEHHQQPGNAVGLHDDGLNVLEPQGL